MVDRKLLERLMSPNRRLCSRPHSHESVIFWDSYFSSYGEFGEFSLRFTAAVSAVAVFTKKAARRRGLWTSLALLQWAAGRVR